MEKMRLVLAVFAFALALSGAFASNVMTADIEGYLQVDGGPCELKALCNNIGDVTCKFGSADVFQKNMSGSQCITALYHRP